MQRSQLQQFCVQNHWQLPMYVNFKNGPDHRPNFTATVTVNGSCFKSSMICRTLKAAQNSAAQVALDRLSGSSSRDNRNSAQVALDHLSGSSSTENGDSPAPNSLPKPDGQHWYKSLLQTYTQKETLHFPTYSTERLGPQHAIRFKSKVTVGGQSYEGTMWFPTVKEAENDVAKIAFQQVSLNEYNKDDLGLHKNALQELAHKRGFLIPTYKTESRGPAHSSTFLSTVMVGGKFYQGLAATKKKQAEVNAAKLAYDDLQNATNDIKCQTQLVNPCVASEESKEQTAGKMPRSPKPCINEMEAREVSKEQTSDTGKMPRSPTPFENELETREVNKEQTVDTRKRPRSPTPFENELETREVDKEQTVDTRKRPRSPAPCENDVEAREEVRKEENVDSEKRPRSPSPTENHVEAREVVSKEQTVNARKRPRSPTPCENEREAEEVSKAQTVDSVKRPRSPTQCEDEKEARKEVSNEQTVDTGKEPRSPTPSENELEAREGVTVKRPLHKILVYPWPKVPNLQETDSGRVSCPQMDNFKDEKKSDIESVMESIQP